MIVDLLEASGVTITAVHITEVRDGIFYAELILRNQEGALPALSARPSDAIAIALRAKVNILASQELLNSAGIEIPAPGQGESENEVEAFREFLDQINPEDFA